MTGRLHFENQPGFYQALFDFCKIFVDRLQFAFLINDPGFTGSMQFENFGQVSTSADNRANDFDAVEDGFKFIFIEPGEPKDLNNFVGKF